MEVRKVCVKCNRPFLARANVAKYCPECRVQAYKDAVMFSKIKKRKQEIEARALKEQRKSLRASARVIVESNTLRTYSDEKFYVEVTQPILKQLEDVKQICQILDAYKNEDRIRILRDLLDRLTKHEVV